MHINHFSGWFMCFFDIYILILIVVSLVVF